MIPTAIDSPIFIDSLRTIFPPARVLHIGVGAGTGGMHAWRDWPVDTAWLVDAHPASMKWLEPLAARHPGWQVRTATLGASAGTATFFHASNPAESGLIPPEAMRALWPNLRQSGSEALPVVTLDSLVDRVNHSADGDWLLIDCLATLPILRGAERTLQQCGVVWARALLAPLDDNAAGDQPGTLEQLRAMLEPLGFRQAHLIECDHPALAEVIFVRNWRAITQQREQLLDERQTRLQQLLDERQTRLQQLQQALAHQQHETQLAHDGLSELRAAGAAQAAALEAELAQARASLAEAEQVRGTLAERDQELARTTQALEAARALQAIVAERDAELARLQHSLEEANGVAGVLAEREAELNGLRRSLEEANAAAGVLADREAELVRLRHSLEEANTAAGVLAEREAELVRLRHSLDEANTVASTLAEREAELARLRLSLEEANANNGMLAERDAELARLQRSLEDAHTVRDTLATREEQLTQLRRELADAQAAHTDAQAARATLAGQEQVLQSQLRTEQDKLQQQQAQHEQERDRQQQELTERDARLQQREADIKMLTARQLQLNQDLLCAEAQIGLIKDVLLREHGL